MKATVGRIVLYVLSEQDASEINRRRTTGKDIAKKIQDGFWPIGAQAHIGSKCDMGDVLPAIVVNTAPFSLQVLLDGTDTFWIQGKCETKSYEPGCWMWPPRE